MKTKETTVYPYDELSESAQAKARDWYREGNASDNFYAESVLDDAKEALKVLGYSSVDIYYSGFSSQGDGACFTGNFYASDYDSKGTNGIQKLLLERPTDKELARCAAELERLLLLAPDLSASIEHFGHYHHEMSTRFSVSYEETGDDSVTDDFKEVSRDLMRWIHKALEAEYEYANSDDVIAENIRCNEYEFTKEGDIA